MRRLTQCAAKDIERPLGQSLRPPAAGAQRRFAAQRSLGTGARRALPGRRIAARSRCATGRSATPPSGGRRRPKSATAGSRSRSRAEAPAAESEHAAPAPTGRRSSRSIPRRRGQRQRRHRHPRPVGDRPEPARRASARQGADRGQSRPGRCRSAPPTAGGPFDVYARPWSGARGARVAIVIGGLGVSQTGTQAGDRASCRPR